MWATLKCSRSRGVYGVIEVKSGLSKVELVYAVAKRGFRALGTAGT
jgi:hypothetical protein